MKSRISTHRVAHVTRALRRTAGLAFASALSLLAASCDGGATAGDMAAAVSDMTAAVTDMAAPPGSDLATPPAGDMAGTPPPDLAGTPQPDLAGTPPPDLAGAPPPDLSGAAPEDMAKAPPDLAQPPEQDFFGHPPVDLAFDAAGIDMTAYRDLAVPKDMAMISPDLAANCAKSLLLEPGMCSDCIKAQCNQQATACLGANWATVDTQGTLCFGVSSCICACNANGNQDCFSTCVQKAGQACATCLTTLEACLKQKCMMVCAP